MLYIGFFHHSVWIEQDGIYYYYNGKEFFDGNSSNIQLVGAPLGTPIILETLNKIFEQPFEIIKGISLLSGTIIVAISYFIAKNIFNSKIAIISQLFIAINPKFQFLSFSALNELLPISLIISSMYFLTKEQLKNLDFLIIGLLLGISFSLRYQAIFVVLGIILFLFLRNKDFRKNFVFAIILISTFILFISPILVFNYITYDDPLENDTSFYLLALSQFQTTEWRESVQNMKNEGLFSIISYDPNLFLENYLFNLFSHNPNKIFNFGSLDNLSFLPFIPIIGFVTVSLGFLHSINFSKNRKSLIILGISFLTLLLVIIAGELSHHYFSIFFISLLAAGIIYLKQIKSNFLPILILSVVIFFSLSIIPAYRSYHFLFLLLPFSILNSIFFLEFLPKVFQRKNLEVKSN